MRPGCARTTDRLGDLALVEEGQTHHETAQDEAALTPGERHALVPVPIDEAVFSEVLPHRFDRGELSGDRSFGGRRAPGPEQRCVDSLVTWRPLPPAARWVQRLAVSARMASANDPTGRPDRRLPRSRARRRRWSASRPRIRAVSGPTSPARAPRCPHRVSASARSITRTARSMARLPSSVSWPQRPAATMSWRISPRVSSWN